MEDLKQLTSCINPFLLPDLVSIVLQYLYLKLTPKLSTFPPFRHTPSNVCFLDEDLAGRSQEKKILEFLREDGSYGCMNEEKNWFCFTTFGSFLFYQDATKHICRIDSKLNSQEEDGVFTAQPLDMEAKSLVADEKELFASSPILGRVDMYRSTDLVCLKRFELSLCLQGTWTLLLTDPETFHVIYPTGPFHVLKRADGSACVTKQLVCNQAHLSVQAVACHGLIFLIRDTSYATISVYTLEGEFLQRIKVGFNIDRLCSDGRRLFVTEKRSNEIYQLQT